MSKMNERKYPKEILEKKTKEELIELIGVLEDEVVLLDFLVTEYENSQQSLGKAFEEQMKEYIENTVLGKAVGDA